ncbi:ABC transporter permease [Rhizobium rhizogenes]|uniref:ABC transporter permease n=1 Tax=Rhizobium rhizogenes TaxID=359 RepID=UPI001571E449|nr:ABC transporter permease [Rhizobium rhizogenes]NTI78468.1 ABC transporter permease [Rhizobium rhizogenes]
MTHLSRPLLLLLSVCVTGLLVVLWQLIADAGLVSRVFLPGPDRAWAALVNGFATGRLPGLWLGTIERMFYGWALASIIGIGLGAAIGVSPTARAYLSTLLELIRPLPASAIIPVAIAFLGLSETMVLSTIAFGALWPTLLATIHGFSTVHPRLYEVGEAMGMSKWATIWKISLPNSMADILAALRLSMTVALILAVVGEMLASRDGLGSWILQAARSFRAQDLFAGVILLGVTGFVTSAILNLLEKRLLRWRPTGVN